MERGRSKARERYRQIDGEGKARQEECKRPVCVCVSRQWALCGLLQHSPSPAVTTHIAGKGQERHQCSSLRFSLQLLVQHCLQSLSPHPPPHPTFTFHIYMQSIQQTRMQSNLSATVEQGHYCSTFPLLYSSLFLSVHLHSFLPSLLFPEHIFQLNLPSISPRMPH